MASSVSAICIRLERERDGRCVRVSSGTRELQSKVTGALLRLSSALGGKRHECLCSSVLSAPNMGARCGVVLGSISGCFAHLLIVEELACPTKTRTSLSNERPNTIWSIDRGLSLRVLTHLAPLEQYSGRKCSAVSSELHETTPTALADAESKRGSERAPCIAHCALHCFSVLGSYKFLQGRSMSSSMAGMVWACCRLAGVLATGPRE